MPESSPTAPLAPGRSDVLPGYTISPLTLTSLAELEDEFARRHVAKLVGGATLVDGADWERAMRLASDETRRTRFAPGTEEWDAAMQSYSSVPLLLYLSLRKHHPQLTRQQAATLLTDDNFTDVRRGILELNGYVFFEAKKKPPTAPNDPGQSTGTGSSASSDATAESTPSIPPSVTPTSAT
jgi:hypothetical protein